MRNRKRTTLGKCRKCHFHAIPAFSTSQICDKCEFDQIREELYNQVHN